MPRSSSITANDFKSLPLLAELFKDFEGLPTEAVASWLKTSLAIKHYAMEERSIADFLKSLPDAFTRKKDLVSKLGDLQALSLGAFDRTDIPESCAATPPPATATPSCSSATRRTTTAPSAPPSLSPSRPPPPTPSSSATG